MHLPDYGSSSLNPENNYKFKDIRIKPPTKTEVDVKIEVTQEKLTATNPVKDETEWPPLQQIKKLKRKIIKISSTSTK